MTNKNNKFLITEENDGLRLDIVLSKKITELTRSNIKKIIESKNVLINNKIIITPSRKTKINELVTINFNLKDKYKIKPYKTKLDIFYICFFCFRCYLQII